MSRIPYGILRRASVVGITLLFVASYRADIQILEGSLTASRFLGLHLADPFVTLEVAASSRSLPVNLLLGTALVTIFYLLAGGRLFCSWVCPYALLSELGGSLRAFLIGKGLLKKKAAPAVPGRLWFFILWIGLAAVTGALIFEIVNPVGILSRFLIYGVPASLLAVLALLAAEILFAGRVWCGRICPVGFVYGLLNRVSAGKIVRAAGRCDGCGRCAEKCPEPEILFFTKDPASAGVSVAVSNSPKCAMCFECVETCPKNAFSYRSKIKDWA